MVGKGRPQQSVPVRSTVQDWDYTGKHPGHCFDPSKGPLDENGAWEGGTEFQPLACETDSSSGTGPA